MLCFRGINHRAQVIVLQIQCLRLFLCELLGDLHSWVPMDLQRFTDRQIASTAHFLAPEISPALSIVAIVSNLLRGHRSYDSFSIGGSHALGGSEVGKDNSSIEIRKIDSHGDEGQLKDERDNRSLYSTTVNITTRSQSL